MTALNLSLLPSEVAEALGRGEHVDIVFAGQKVGELGPENLAEESNATRALRRIREAGLVVTPARGRPNTGDWLGCMRGTSEVLGDIVAPAGAPEDWEALRS